MYQCLLILRMQLVKAHHTYVLGSLPGCGRLSAWSSIMYHAAYTGFEKGFQPKDESSE